MKRIPALMAGALLLLVLLVSGCARSTSLLRGSKAEEFLGDKLHLTQSDRYTCLLLKNRQASVLMAAIFNRDRGGEHSGNFDVVKREKSMGYHSSDNPFTAVILNSPSGKRGGEPDGEIIDEIIRSRLTPAVVFNADGEEEAVVYLPTGQRLAAFLRPDGEIRLELGFRTRGEGDIRYLLELTGRAPETTKTSSRMKIDSQKENNLMSEIRIGDLVQWDTETKTRVGVVKSIDSGGIATINVPTTGGSREEKIAVRRLKVITSTIEPE